jgi:membrane associated rhomboid family serine protease
MKNVNKILIVVLFLIIIGLLIAFSSVYPFTTVGYGWQCAICGFFGLLWIICLLIEICKKDIEV